jgi:methionyl-tRNA formyltransferase
MRIVLFGQAAFGEKVLERLIGRKEDVIGVCIPPDPPGAKNPMKEMAEKAGIPVFQPKRMKGPEAFEAYKGLKPDLNVLAFVTEMIPPAILDHPRHGSIQYHPSLLPRHRGKSAINWAVIRGEKRTGLSIFWVDAGIDTGPILLQKEVEIDPEDTTGSLYFNKLFPLGVDALVEALDLIKSGKAPRIFQDESQATYEPPCEEPHGRIDWEKPLHEVYNLIRGCDPQPGAYGFLQGRKVKIYATRALRGHAAPGQPVPGEIIEVTEEGITIAAEDGALLVEKVRGEGEGKMGAAEFARTVRLRAGMRFSS